MERCHNGADQRWLIGLALLLVPGLNLNMSLGRAWRILCLECISKECIREWRVPPCGVSLYLVMIRLLASTATHCKLCMKGKERE